MARDPQRMRDALAASYEAQVRLLYRNLVTALADIDDNPNEAVKRFENGLRFAEEAYERGGEAIERFCEVRS